MDVLYSLLDIENQQLNMIVKDQKFTTSLNFVLTMITNNVLLIDDCKLDRFCINTLSKIALNIKSLIVESESMERILLAADYPNLVILKFFNLNNKTASKYFTVKSPFHKILEKQIRDLMYTNI
ncbi:unnamed protein product [Rotaria sordida]|uniref:Uncharacterized protein n=1 Tax=Rotaria sordida TaxID=392033 RepID=A0A815XV04_9BILA|nr:unnamed protein product [Rotaria sordida]CAF1562363.1 unnamed protein product [Rotaria sordida]